LTTVSTLRGVISARFSKASTMIDWISLIVLSRLSSCLNR
jgi:hypothetical protein